MSPPGVRRASVLRVRGVALAGALACAAVAAGAPREARAQEPNDSALAHLCSNNGTSCATDAQAASRFRSLMSELGVVVAPGLQTPADTLGFAGFQVSAELGLTQISRDLPFWDGVASVQSGNTSARRPDAWLTTVGAFVRKGMWLPIPSIEWGAGAVNLMHSGMWSVQGYMKLALHEGFQRWPVPSLAARAAVAQVLGTDQVSLTVTSVDLLISKAFSLAGTARFELFGGWNFLLITARSGVIDPTPACDAVKLAGATTRADAMRSVPSCVLPPLPTTPGQPDPYDRLSDLNANFTFSDQDAITRHRFYGGLKLKLAALFVVGQVAVIPASHSRDERATTNPARDDGRRQQQVSISAGLDF